MILKTIKCIYCNAIAKLHDYYYSKKKDYKAPRYKCKSCKRSFIDYSLSPLACPECQRRL